MKKKLSEVCKFQYGYPFDSSLFSDTDGTPVIRIRDIVRGFSETKTTETCSDDYIVDNGDILIGMDGEFNLAKWKGGKAFLNQRVCKLIPFDVNKDYIFYHLPKILKNIEEKTSFVTVKHLSAKQLNSIYIDIPEQTIQYKIANIFIKIDSLINKRKQQLSKLDQLVKSRFIEMFGDPVANDKNWPIEELDSICSAIVDCPHSTPSYTAENTGYMCIRSSIVKKNNILWDEIEYIPETEYHQRILRKKPEKGDIIYTREGAILGIAAMIDRDCNVALGQRSMLLSPNSSKCLPQFLSVSMNFDSFLRKALGGISGSASPHINVGDIKAFAIILPPVTLQEQFVTFVEQVDKSKLAVKQSLEKLETLKKSLMQEYFG